MNCIIHKGASSLQEVTDTGATTTKAITLNLPASTNAVVLHDTTTNADVLILRVSGSNTGKLQVMAGGNTTAFVDSVDGIVFGGSVADVKSVLTLTSTTKGAILPSMSTTQRDAITSPTEGLIIYNLTDHKLQVYNGSAWANVPG